MQVIEADEDVYARTAAPKRNVTVTVKNKHTEVPEQWTCQQRINFLFKLRPRRLGLVREREAVRECERVRMKYR